MVTEITRLGEEEVRSKFNHVPMTPLLENFLPDRAEPLLMGLGE